MAKNLDIVVEQDHIESLTKASGINALSELLWNSLDADASPWSVYSVALTVALSPDRPLLVKFGCSDHVLRKIF